MSISQRGVVTMIVLAVAMLLSAASAGDNDSLWKIQQTLASKTYVDLRMNFSRAFHAGPDFRMRHARQYTGTKNDQVR
jgi:hypothetical protein